MFHHVHGGYISPPRALVDTEIMDKWEPYHCGLLKPSPCKAFQSLTKLPAFIIFWGDPVPGSITGRDEIVKTRNSNFSGATCKAVQVLKPPPF